MKTYTGLSRNHTTDAVVYPQSPPVGGNHNPVWQNCGVYDTPLINEHAVHSLEHGAVWITYQPDLPKSQVAVLDAFAVNQTHILVSPYPGLTSPVVLTAWGLQLAVDSVVDPRIAQFVAEYEEGPQTPELGVTCSGGFGDPIS
ncbi:MAG: putative rane protein [Ilumatobacteraceae bacterium]|nr:putative rane protein [Ilumatobacteraceae bacterium]